MLNYQRVTIPKSSLCKNVLIQTIPMDPHGSCGMFFFATEILLDSSAQLRDGHHFKFWDVDPPSRPSRGSPGIIGPSLPAVAISIHGIEPHCK